MTAIEGILFQYLRSSRIKVEISGFDMESFSEAMHRELSRRLDDIQCIAFEDEDLMTNSEKIAAIKGALRETGNAEGQAGSNLCTVGFGYPAITSAAALLQNFGRAAGNIPEARQLEKLFCHPLCSFLSTFSTGLSTGLFPEPEGFSTLSTELSTSLMLVFRL